MAWRQLIQRYGLLEKSEPELQPFTGTLRGLPANMNPAIFLPKVGVGPTQTEEETRESLRRFIVDWKSLIGADPAQLSLTERVDEPTGARLARYEQRPFRYPLRGGYGNLLIRFSTDRRVLDLSSTCLPNTDRLQAALNAIVPKINGEEVSDHIKGRSITVTDSSGKQQTFTVTTINNTNVPQLVVYALPAKLQNNTLELRLAWEIELTNAPVKTIYVDAVDEQVIGSS